MTIKKTTILILIFSSLFLIRCSPKLAKMVTSEPIYSIEQINCLYEQEELALGQQIMVNHCQKCHKLPELHTYTPTQWNHILRNMIPYTKLNYEEARLLRAYLLEGSAKVN